MRDHPLALAILLAAAFVGIRCSTSCAPVDPPPLGPDAGSIDAGPCSDGVHDACDLAAQRLCDLGCDVRGSSGIDRVWGTSDDDTWTEACRIVRFSTICIASATTCEQAEQCE